MKTWVRFRTNTGETILGKIEVPKTAPTWFQPILDSLNQGKTNRTLTMEDIKVNEWLDALCSSGQPIPVYKPLSLQLVPDTVYVSRDSLIRLRKEAEGISKTGEDTKLRADLRFYYHSDLIEISKNAETKSKLPTDLVGIDAKTADYLDIPSRTRPAFFPMVDYVSDNVDTYRLCWQNVIDYIETQVDFDDAARAAYKETVEQVREGSLIKV